MEGMASSPIGALELSRRTEHHLRLQGIHTVGELVARTPEQLLALRQIGHGSLAQISEALSRHGLQLRRCPMSA